MAITIEKVEAIAAKLRAMPPVENKKREISKQESIKLLTGEITAMRERGVNGGRFPHKSGVHRRHGTA